jgi:hypothetical protein
MAKAAGDWHQLALRPGPAGVWLPLKVVPGASQSRILGLHGDALKVQVAAPPSGGAANEAVLRLLAQQLDLAGRHLELLSGHRGPRKVIVIRGLAEQELRQRLRACCDPAR